MKWRIPLCRFAESRSVQGWEWIQTPPLLILPPLSSSQVIDLCTALKCGCWNLKSHISNLHICTCKRAPPPLTPYPHWAVSLDANRTLPLVGQGRCLLGSGLYDSLCSPTACEGCAAAFPESLSTEGLIQLPSAPQSKETINVFPPDNLHSALAQGYDLFLAPPPLTDAGWCWSILPCMPRFTCSLSSCYDGVLSYPAREPSAFKAPFSGGGSDQNNCGQLQRPSYCRPIAGHLDFVAMLLCLPAPKSSSGTLFILPME